MECAIGRLKKYHILRNVLPISMISHRGDNDLATVDKILIICAALNNLSKPLVTQINTDMVKVCAH